jgi:hypothetical protein
MPEVERVRGPRTDQLQLWVVQPDRNLFPDSKVKVILWAMGREDAKRSAWSGWLNGLGDPDNFIVTPITNPGDRVKLEITLNV